MSQFYYIVGCKGVFIAWMSYPDVDFSIVLTVLWSNSGLIPDQ